MPSPTMITLSNRITRTFLETHLKRCSLDKFDQVFPDGAEVTLDNCIKAVLSDLNIESLLHSIFDTTARQAYDRTLAPFKEKYTRTVQLAWQDYHTARKTWDQVELVRQAEWEKLGRAEAATFYELYRRYMNEISNQIHQVS